MRQRRLICRAQQEKRRRLLTVVAVLKFILKLQVLHPGYGKETASLHGQRFSLQELQSRMTRDQWRRSFRMDIEDIQDLFALFADNLHHNVIKAINSSGSPIAPECRLLMALQWCAGGSYLDLIALFSVSKSAFFENLWLVLETLVQTCPVIFKMDAPSCME